MAPPDELRHSSSARLGSITTIITTTTEQPVFFINFVRNKCRRHQPQPQHNSRRHRIAAAAAAAAAMRRGWRWRWRLRRQRCGIATVVDKISTEYDITQQQRTRSHRRERGSAGSLAPTPEVARSRHASPATLWCLRIKVGLCLPLPSTAHSEQCLLCAAVWVVPSFPLILSCRCAWRATVLSSVFVGQSYELVVIDGSSL